MKSPLPMLVLFVAGLVLGGCSALPSEISPIEFGEYIPFDCSGWITAGHSELALQTEEMPELRIANKVVNLELQVVGLKRSTAAALLQGDSVGMVVAPMKTLEARKLVKALLKTETAVDHHPLHTAIDNKARGIFSFITQKSYVNGFKTLTTVGAFIANPQICVLDTGLVFEMAPEIISEGKAVVLDLAITSLYGSEKFMPISMPHPDSGEDVSFEVPLVTGQIIKTKPTVAVGGTFVVTGLIAEHHDEVYLAFITVSAVDISAGGMP
jgi:hypothetical protein